MQVCAEPGGGLAQARLRFRYLAEGNWKELSGKAVRDGSCVSVTFPAVTTQKLRLDLDAEGQPSPDVIVPIREVAVWREDDRGGIDQANETGNRGWHSLFGRSPHWQTFIPTKETIVKVALRLQNVTDSFRPHEAGITVSVQAERGGPDLALASLPPEELSGGWNYFRFPKPLTVTPGKTYWLQFKCTKPVSAKHRYVLTTGGNHDRGGLDWGKGVSRHDIGFRTYFRAHQ